MVNTIESILKYCWLVCMKVFCSLKQYLNVIIPQNSKEANFTIDIISNIFFV